MNRSARTWCVSDTSVAPRSASGQDVKTDVRAQALSITAQSHMLTAFRDIRPNPCTDSDTSPISSENAPLPWPRVGCIVDVWKLLTSATRCELRVKDLSVNQLPAAECLPTTPVPRSIRALELRTSPEPMSMYPSVLHSTIMLSNLCAHTSVTHRTRHVFGLINQCFECVCVDSEGPGW